MAVLYHGTSWPLYRHILETGYLKPRVYVANNASLAREFSSMRVRYHPDPEWRRFRRVILELDMTGFALIPDDDPEATAPGTRFTGNLFYVEQPVPADRIVSVTYHGFPEHTAADDLPLLQQSTKQYRYSVSRKSKKPASSSLAKDHRYSITTVRRV